MRSAARVGWIVIVAAALGCSKGDSNASTSFGPPPWMGPDDESGSPPGTSDDSGNDTSETSAADGTSNGTTPDDTSGGTTTGTPPPMEGSTSGPPPGDSGGTFGDDGGNGMQPGSGWWAHCIPQAIACDPGFACLSTDANNDGVCTQECVPAGNTSNCGASPGGTNMPVCLTVGGQSICALGCDGGLTCPGGMVCINETDDTGPISICI